MEQRALPSLVVAVGLFACHRGAIPEPLAVAPEPIAIAEVAADSTVHSAPVSNDSGAAAQVVPPCREATREFARASNAFGFDLYRRLRERPGNLAFSPTSLSTALTMASAGARNTTAAEMRRVLHLPANRASVATDAGRLAASITTPRRQVTVRIANRLFGDQEFTPNPGYIDAIAGGFGARLEPVDFASEPERARERINSWVEQQTEHRIPNLLGPGAVDADTKLVLVNAIYFLGEWTQPFARYLVRSAPFHLDPERVIQVPTMHQLARRRIGTVPHAKMLEIPYGDGTMSMLILLPDATSDLAALERSLDARTIDAGVARLRTRWVALLLPKFEIAADTALSLKSPLEALGMRTAFDQDKADFTGLSALPGLVITDVVHKAYLRVDERGTEAAAASAALKGRQGDDDDPPSIAFSADHPFLFAIRDQATGLILFMGRVQDPSAH